MRNRVLVATLMVSACSGYRDKAGTAPAKDAETVAPTDGLPPSRDDLGSGADGAGLSGDGAGAGDASTASAGGPSDGASPSDGAAGTVPAGLPPGYALQIDQPFSQPEALADLVFADPSDWRFTPAGGGALETFAASYLPPHRSPTTVAVLAGKRLGSFVLEVEIMETSNKLADPHRDFTILWDVQTPSRFYYAHISAKHDPTVAHNIHIVADADRRPITQQATSGYDWGVNTWKKLRVVRDADTGAMAVTDLATGTVLLTASDKRFADGFIGFGSVGDPGRIRNLRVWAASATVVAPAFFQHKP
jgi:hypothetical protein